MCSDDLAHEPVVAGARRACASTASTASRVAARLDRHDADGGLVEAQLEQRVVELAEGLRWPTRDAPAFGELLGGLRLLAPRARAP